MDRPLCKQTGVCDVTGEYEESGRKLGLRSGPLLTVLSGSPLLQEILNDRCRRRRGRGRVCRQRSGGSCNFALLSFFDIFSLARAVLGLVRVWRGRTSCRGRRRRGGCLLSARTDGLEPLVMRQDILCRNAVLGNRAEHGLDQVAAFSRMDVIERLCSRSSCQSIEMLTFR